MRSRRYYGWNIVAYSILCQMMLVGTTQASFGLYVVPVSEEFGLSRANTNLAIILMNVGIALFTPLMGWLADRVSIRPLLLIGGVLTALSLALLSLSHAVLLSALVIAFVLTGGESATMRPGTVLIVRWFDANRGRALTLGAVGLSLASIIIAPLVGYMIGAFGWRTALLVSAVLAGVVVIVPALFLRLVPRADEKQRETPSSVSYDAPDQPPARPLPIGALLRMPQFWCIGFAIAIPMSISQAVAISMAPMAVEAGIPVAQAATLASAAGLMALTGKLGLAIIADKVNQMLLLTAAFCIGAVENVILFLVAGSAPYHIMLMCAVMQGLSSGMLMPLFNALLARQFGPASFGTALGLMFPIISLNNALFARFAGEVFDRTGSYHFAFASFAVLEVVAAALMLSARRLPRSSLLGGSTPAVRTA